MKIEIWNDGLWYCVGMINRGFYENQTKTNERQFGMNIWYGIKCKNCTKWYKIYYNLVFGEWKRGGMLKYQWVQANICLA